MTPEISIIVPIFNTEKYIDRCLKSILSKSQYQIEVLCIDDGSTDRSLAICEEIQLHDSRVKVFTQENQGVSSARNFGLEMASGRWLFFVDSDDVVLPGYYEAIVEADEQNDVVLFDFIWGEKTYCGREEKMKFNNAQSRKLIHPLIKSETITEKARTSLRSPCGKAYKREFLTENKIKFPINIKIGEDMLFNILVFAKAEHVFYNPVDVYHVFVRDGSATHSYVKDMMEHDLVFLEQLKNILLDTGMFEETKLLYYSEVKSGILRCLRKQICYPGNDKSMREKRHMLDKLLEAESYREAFLYHDNNWKRNMVLFLVKHKCIRLLDFMLRITE